MYSKFKLRQKR